MTILVVLVCFLTMTFVSGGWSSVAKALLFRKIIRGNLIPAYHFKKTMMTLARLGLAAHCRVGYRSPPYLQNLWLSI